MSIDKATPRPWHEGRNENGYVEVYRGSGIYGASGGLIAETLESLKYPSNAELIVIAVNSFNPRKEEALKALAGAANQCRTLLSTLKHRNECDPVALNAAVHLTAHKVEVALSLAGEVMGGQTE